MANTANVEQIRQMSDGEVAILEASLYDAPQHFKNTSGKGKWTSRTKFRVQDPSGSIGITCWNTVADRVAEVLTIRDIGKKVTIAGRVEIRNNPHTGQPYRSLSVNGNNGTGVDLGGVEDRAPETATGTIRGSLEPVSTFDFVDKYKLFQAKLALDGVDSDATAAVMTLASYLGIIKPEEDVKEKEGPTYEDGGTDSAGEEPQDMLKENNVDFF